MVLQPDTSEIAMMIIGAVTQQGSYTEFKGVYSPFEIFDYISLHHPKCLVKFYDCCEYIGT